MTSGARRLALLAALAAIGAGAWALAGRQDVFVRDEPLDTVETAAAPDAPLLAVAPGEQRPVEVGGTRAVRTRTAEKKNDGATSVAPLPEAGQLVIEWEPQPPNSTSTLKPWLGTELRISDAADRSIRVRPPADPEVIRAKERADASASGGLSVDLSVGLEVESSQALVRPTARGQFRDELAVQVVVVSGLPEGAWLVSAVPKGADSGLAPWLPVWVSLGSEGTTVRLRAATSAEWSTVNAQLTVGDRPVPAKFEVRWRGALWEVFPNPSVAPLTATTFLPSNEEFTVEVLAGFENSAGLGIPPAQRIETRPGTPAHVKFELPAAEELTVRVTSPTGEAIPRPRVGLWRLPPQGHAEFVESNSEGNDPAAGVYRVRLSPGRYGIMVSNVPGFASAWKAVEVLRGAPNEALFTLQNGFAPPRLLLLDAEGKPAANLGLWIGRLDGPSPEESATSLSNTDDAGRVEFSPLPFGTYLLADYGRSVWREVEIGPRGFEEDVLRLPPPPANDWPKIAGTVFEPSGRLVKTALVSLGPVGNGWSSYTHMSSGTFTLAAPPGVARITLHHSWFYATRFAPFAQDVRLEGTEPRRVEIRLKPK